MDLFQFKIGHSNILVYRSIFTPVKSNMYTILGHEEAFVFDPNVDESLIELFKRQGVYKIYLFLTHEHYDHTSGVNWLRKQFDCELFCQSDCSKSIAIQRNNNPALIALVLAEEDRKDHGTRYRDFKSNFKPYTCYSDYKFDTDALYSFGDIQIQAHSSPGHSPGSCCYTINSKIVLTGDSLLQDIPVITRFTESNKADYDCLTLPFLQSLPKDSIILPGHGNPFILAETNNI